MTCTCHHCKTNTGLAVWLAICLCMQPPALQPSSGNFLKSDIRSKQQLSLRCHSSLHTSILICAYLVQLILLRMLGSSTSDSTGLSFSALICECIGTIQIGTPWHYYVRELCWCALNDVCTSGIAFVMCVHGLS